MFDCSKFLKEYNIDIKTSGKNTAPGWIQITCPLCNDTSSHGGFNIKSGFYNCWLCGKHHPTAVIQHLLNVSQNEACLIMRQYQTTKVYYDRTEEIQRAEKIIYPIGTEKIKKTHKDYLIKRNYDPDKLEKEYNLKGTDHIGDYKFRIICPIYLNHKLVSYQGRDITDKSEIRYKACTKEDEIMDHKKTLYNIDNANKESVIIVEGITDVWRIGKNSICTFGVKYTIEQIYMIASKYNKVFIMFDPDAHIQAEKLGYDLSGLNIETHVIYLEETDPGKFTETEALYINNQLIGK